MKKIIFLIIVLTFISCTNMDKDTVQKYQIIEKVNQLFIETDNKNWNAVSGIFAENVLFDMSSMTGVTPTKIASGEIVSAWEKGLKEIEHLHHQVGNFIINYKGNEAEVFCYGIAYHYKPVLSGMNVRTFVGSYNIHLIKNNEEWEIDAFKFNLKFIDGNKKL